MTAPGYVPPPVPGWWVKGNFALFPSPKDFTLTGKIPLINRGPSFFPSQASLALTGQLTRVTVGPTVFPTKASLALTGSAPRLSTTLRPNKKTLTLTMGRPVVGAHYSDDFTSTAVFAANWTNRLNTMAVDATNGAAYGAGVFVDNFATYNRSMPTSDIRITVQMGPIGSFGENFSIILGANTAGECALFEYEDDGALFTIHTMSSWAAKTAQSIATGATVNNWDIFVFERIGNNYNVFKNGSLIVTWLDSGNVVPRNFSHGYVGIGAFNDFTNFWRFNTWQADNI